MEVFCRARVPEFGSDAGKIIRKHLLTKLELMMIEVSSGKSPCREYPFYL